MSLLKKLFFHSNYKLLGLLVAILPAVILLILYYLVHAGKNLKDNSLAWGAIIFVVLSPILTIILTCLRLHREKNANDSFIFWVKTCFINFSITTGILFLTGALVSHKENVLRALLFERLYLLLFALIIGLALSALAAVLFKK